MRDDLAIHEETRDTATHFFIGSLPPGAHVLETSARFQHAGVHQSGIAEIRCIPRTGGVVSGNSIATGSADFQSVGMPVPRPISDRESSFGGSENPAMDVIWLMVVAMAGWNYHRERNHQGLENKIIDPEFGAAKEGDVNCRERLGGLLRYYYRDAA